MFGIGSTDELISFLFLVAIFVGWYRLFCRDRKFSILALLALTLAIAVWLALFRPWEGRFI
jgi:hypothetical protein